MRILPVALLFGALLAVSPAMAQTQPEAPVAGLSVDSGMKTLLADPNAKEVIAKYAPAVVEFFTSGQAEGLMPAETPLAVLAQNPMAIDAGLNAANMKKISAALQPR
jgi:hypothetical protein